MKQYRLVAAFVFGIVPLSAATSEPRAAAQAQQTFWEFTEKIALALPGDAREVLEIVGASEPSAAFDPVEFRAERIALGPSLLASDAIVRVGEDGRAASVSFYLKESCIPFSSVRNRYQAILVISHGKGASEQEWDVFGTRVGDALISYWYQGTRFGCMRKVEITPAALAKVNL